MAIIRIPHGNDPPLLERLVDSLRNFMHWLSPDGKLQSWLKWCLMVAIMFGVPALLFIPLITFLLGAVAEWMALLVKVCQAFLFALCYLAAALLVLAIILAVIKQHNNRQRQQRRR